MSDRVIVFENVSKSYPLYHHIRGGIKNCLFNLPKAMSAFKAPHFEALKDISFEVKQGESLGIIGKNGAGKSTLLGLIAGVLKPNKGKVTIRGRVSPLLELGAGFHPDLTGKENIMLNGVLMGLSRNEVYRKLDEIIYFSELEDFIDQPIRTYSSGMLARLGFSVVSSLDPELLLIDEVLAVGDSQFHKKCIQRMLDFKQAGVTIVFVSHSMENVLRICSRAMWIHNHRRKMLGDTESVVTNYSN